METNVKIIIVDDSPLFCARLKNELLAFPNYEVIKLVTDSVNAVDAILTHKPDIVLLDIVMPTIDGEEILEQLSCYKDLRCGVIIISSATNDRIISRCMALGAYYYMLKPYDIKLLSKKIIQTYEAVKSSNYEYAAAAVDQNTKREVTEEMIKARITKFLISSGISPKLKGFFFLKDSIHYVYNSGNDLCSVTKIIYPHVANIYETEPERVERSIRSAIEKGMKSDDGRQFYFSTVGCVHSSNTDKPLPSNRQFIFTIAEYIKNTIDDPYAI